jgi:hypothetical protein
MTPRLGAQPLVDGDHQQGSLGPGRARDHVPEKMRVAGNIDEYQGTGAGSNKNLCGIDGQAIPALGLEMVYQKCPLIFEAGLPAESANLFNLHRVDAAAIEQQTADQSRLAMVGVARDDQVQRPGSIHDYM